MAWCDAARLFGKTQTHSGRPWPNKPCPLRMNVSVSHAWLWLWIPPSYLKFRHSDIQQGLAKRPKRKCGGQILAITPTPTIDPQKCKSQLIVMPGALNAQWMPEKPQTPKPVRPTFQIRIQFDPTKSASSTRGRNQKSDSDTLAFLA